MIFPRGSTVWGKSSVLKIRRGQWSRCAWVTSDTYHGYLALGTHSSIYWAEICYHTHTDIKKKKKKGGEAAVWFPWQWCNAADTLGQDGAARSVTARRVPRATRAALHRLKAVSNASTSPRASFSSRCLDITAQGAFLKLTRSYCMAMISKTIPFAVPSRGFYLLYFKRFKTLFFLITTQTRYLPISHSLVSCSARMQI